MPEIPGGHYIELTQSLQAFAFDLDELERKLREVLQFYSPPPEIASIRVKLQLLESMFDGYRTADPFSFPDTLSPLVKTIIMRNRRKLANSLDGPRTRTLHPDLLEELDKKLHPFDIIIELPWFHKADALIMPQLGDFLTLDQVERLVVPLSGTPQSRVYDEKFHILQSPSLIPDDLQFYRSGCESRRARLAFVFMDIDDFKRFNTNYGETKVDRNMLPVFMRELEAFCFARGHAYRYGGDEYALLLPGPSLDESVFILDGLRRQIEGLSFNDIELRAHVSIGVCVIGADCYLTNREIVSRAERAKNYAKKEGKKNCVATYRGELFGDKDLYVAASARTRRRGA